LRRIASIVLTICLGFVSLIAAGQETQSFDDLVAQATAANERNDAAVALDLYSKALKVNPRWMQGWWLVGLLQYNAGQFAPARDALTKFLDFGPDPQAYALRGMCEFETAEYADSLADLQRAISLGAPDDASNEQALHFYEAMLLTRLGKFEESGSRTIFSIHFVPSTRRANQPKKHAQPFSNRQIRWILLPARFGPGNAQRGLLE